MLINTLLIVADRGGLRAYRIGENPNRAPGLHPIDSFEAQETHGRFQDKVTDQAGRFKGSGASDQSAGGTAEHPTIEMENDRRACKHVAQRINELVTREKPEGWLLAIPATIHRLVEEHLSSEASQHLSEVVHADLLHTEPTKILTHFSALQHA